LLATHFYRFQRGHAIHTRCVILGRLDQSRIGVKPDSDNHFSKLEVALNLRFSNPIHQRVQAMEIYSEAEVRH
jgi:hypothetical protein